jgi:hypothetical protein
MQTPTGGPILFPKAPEDWRSPKAGATDLSHILIRRCGALAVAQGDRLFRSRRAGGFGGGFGTVRDFDTIAVLQPEIIVG